MSQQVCIDKPLDRPATGKSGNKISFLGWEVKSRMRSIDKITPDILNIFHQKAAVEQKALDFDFI